MGRRHRHPLGDEVHRRPRHQHRRCRRGGRAPSTGPTGASRSSPTRRRAYHGLQFHETFGTYGYLMKLRAETLRDLGAALTPVQRVPVPAGPGDAVAADGRATSPTRWRSRSSSTRHELVSNVTYAGLPASRYRPLVDKYLPRGAGAVFSFECAGGRAGGQDLIRGVTLWSHLANVGDAKSLDHPPGQHDPPPVQRRRADCGRGRPWHRAAVGRHRSPSRT